MKEFEEKHKIYFGTDVGAFAIVTPTENSDSQITITKHGNSIVTDYFNKDNIVRGGKSTNPELSLKEFLLYPNKKKIKLNLVFPKPTRTELRIYLSAENGFKPLAGDIWFIFKNEAKELVIGYMDKEMWRSIGTNSLSKEVSTIIPRFIEIANEHIVGQGTRPEANVFVKENRFSAYGFSVEVSFGIGRSSEIPWIALTDSTQKVTNGIYPVYLYFRHERLLILSYGVSQKNTPKLHWPNQNSLQKIENFYQKNYQKKPEKYGNSFIYKTYDTANLPNREIMEKDLKDITNVYREALEVSPVIVKDFFNHELFNTALASANLVFSPELVSRYIASLLSKRFVILTGLSGSGKTQLAKSFAQWMSMDKDQYCIVPVGADWTNRDPLLGYPNGLNSREYVLPETGVLQLLIHARKTPELPHFLVLDEMNLSHVERYFADFLSVMESDETILLQNEEKSGVPDRIGLPKNVFITGTVNIDETTYMFSPKVLDRANVIEFRIESSEMETFLQSPVGATPIANTGKTMGQSFLEMTGQTINAKTMPQVAEVLLKFFNQLQQVGTEFGYRTAAEIHRLMHFLEGLGITDADKKIDIAVMQKLLPKLHGSRRKLVPVLEVMAGFCIELPDGMLISDVLQGKAGADIVPVYPLTLGKLKRMYRSAIDNGFASYAEA